MVPNRSIKGVRIMMLHNLKDKSIIIDGDKYKVLDDNLLFYIFYKWDYRVSNTSDLREWKSMSYKNRKTGVHYDDTTEMLVIRKIGKRGAMPEVWPLDEDCYDLA